MSSKFDKLNDSSNDTKRTPSNWNKVYPGDDKDNSKERDQDRDRDRDKDRDRERGRDRDRSRDRKDKDRERSRDRKEKDRDRDMYKDRDDKSESIDISALPKRKPRHFDGRDKVIVVKRLNDLGDKPITIVCPFCEEKITTDVDYKAGGITWAWCGGITGAGLCNPLVWVFCLCWIPFCIPKCKNARHYCHNCNKYLGTFKVL